MSRQVKEQSDFEASAKTGAQDVVNPFHDKSNDLRFEFLDKICLRKGGFSSGLLHG